MIKCEIRIERIMFPKDKPIQSGDFAIFAGKVVKHIEGEYPAINKIFKTVSLKGNVPCLEQGDTFTITFNEPEINKFGTSYTVMSVTKDIDPNDRGQVRDYLNTMCGRNIASEIMKLEEPYFTLRNKESDKLLEIKGIGEARLQQIYNKMDSYSDNTLAFIQLEPLGLTKNQIKNICFEVGGAISAVDICKNHPYSLIKKVKGMGFKIIDEIAIKCGMNPFAPIRLKSAITYLLEEAGESGKSYLYAPQLLTEVKKIVSIEFFTLDAMVKEMINSGELFISEDGMMVALPYYIKLEQDIAKEIFRLRNAKSRIVVPEDWRKQVRAIEDKQGWNYTDEQMKGIELVLTENLVVVSGKAGSGKSTITNAMTEVLDDYDIALCCLSAKASQRLREVTEKDASTIHKLLGLGMQDEDTPSDYIYADIIIVDEASMVSGTIFLKLLKSIESGSKLIILGDDGQLTAIGDCAVFSDLMISKIIPHIELTKIHRQAELSAIITKSIDFRNQIKICDNNFSGHIILGELQDLELYVLEEELLLEQIKLDFMSGLSKINDILEIQIISALKTRGSLSIHNINLEIQKMVNCMFGDKFEGKNKVEIFLGDKVINLKNNYNSKDTEGKKREVFNGSIGIVKSISKDEVVIDFVGIGKVVIAKEKFNNISLAYAISCHSSQGSQWKRVICGFDMSAYTLLNVELIYTALTRAIEHCTLIISRKALNHASRTIEQKTKQTLLPMFLSNLNK